MVRKAPDLRPLWIGWRRRNHIERNRQALQGEWEAVCGADRPLDVYPLLDRLCQRGDDSCVLRRGCHPGDTYVPAATTVGNHGGQVGVRICRLGTED